LAVCTHVRDLHLCHSDSAVAHATTTGMGNACQLSQNDTMGISCNSYQGIEDDSSGLMDEFMAVEADVPVQCFLESQVLDETVKRAVSAQLSIHSCLLPMEEEEQEELDFSKDRGMHPKRTPATFVGRVSEMGEALHSMPPSTNSCLAHVKIHSLSDPVREGGRSYYLRKGGIVASSAPSYASRAATSMSAQPSTSCVQRCESLSEGPLVEELQLDSSCGVPDPSLLPLRDQILTLLGITSESATIARMEGFQGGQNQGVWVLQNKQRTLILKLVEGRRRHQAVPTEGEQFVRIANCHPAIRSDPDLGFPIKVFRCSDSKGLKHYDLSVMLKAPGICLAEVIAVKYSDNQVPQLLKLFEALGRFLAGIHHRYNMQHHDFHPSNVFHDESTGHFTLIDVGGMDSSSSLRESDIDHFGEYLRIFSRGMQAHDLSVVAFHRFKAGYAACKF